jgi:hypothetical protein
MYTTDTYLIPQSTLDKVRREYDVAFQQAKPRRLNWYVWLEQEHGVINLVVDCFHRLNWQYQATFDNEKSASAFLLKWS